MAAQRPNVIVYQEYEALTVAPDIPDLNVLIVGPCFQILDYLDDKVNCYADVYGELNSSNPFADPAAVILAGPPNAAAGAELDASSVKVFFDSARLVMVADDSSTAGLYGTYALGSNLFYAHDASTGRDFAQENIAAGDILIAQGSAADHIKTVKEVVSTFIDIVGSQFNFQTKGVAPGDIITIVNDNPPGSAASRNGSYTVHRVRDENTLELLDTGWTQNPSGTFTGTDTCEFTITTPQGAVRVDTTVTGAVEMANYSDLYTTTDFSEASPVSAQWRLERQLDDLVIDSSYIATDGNQITIASGVEVDVIDGSVTLENKKISYAKIYVEYTALRTDLQKMTTLSNFSEMETTLGKYDARNPLFVGSVVAKANTTTAIQVYGVKADTLVGYLDFIDRISSEREVYAIVPLTYNTSVLAAINNMCDSLADPNYVLTEGIKQKFRVCIGAVDLQTSKEMISEHSGAKTDAVTGTAPSINNTLTFTVGAGAAALDLSAEGVLPGWVVRYTELAGPVHTWTVAHVADALEIRVDAMGTLPPAPVDGDIFAIYDASDLITPVYTQTAAGAAAISLTASAKTLRLELVVPGAQFITSGLIPGDYLEMPKDLVSNAWESAAGYSWVIDTVLSEERLLIVNNGTNTSTVVNELPYGYKRDDATAVPQTGVMYFRVIRQLDKTQQVTEMIAVANSFSSKRQLLCYPNLVDIAGLVDGSLTRSDLTEPELADPQPGYYLACAVGGQTAGQPPQQGFTNIGIAGITEIYNSNTYFKEKQITNLSNGGVYVFVQDNPSALPYSVHEVTTDVSTLEFSEYMVVKDFDFIAWTFLDTLLPFIGPWNVIPETVEFIRQATFSTGNALKSRYVSKIGPPLVDYTLDGVDISELSRDRIEAFINVDLPMTLNTIGLHLVA
jgi:hypothetical protein